MGSTFFTILLRIDDWTQQRGKGRDMLFYLGFVNRVEVVNSPRFYKFRSSHFKIETNLVTKPINNSNSIHSSSPNLNCYVLCGFYQVAVFRCRELVSLADIFTTQHEYQTDSSLLSHFLPDEKKYCTTTPLIFLESRSKFTKDFKNILSVVGSSTQIKSPPNIVKITFTSKNVSLPDT